MQPQLQLTSGGVHNSPHLSQLTPWRGAHSADNTVPESQEKAWNLTEHNQEATGAWVLSGIQSHTPPLFQRCFTLPSQVLGFTGAGTLTDALQSCPADS